MLKDSCCKSLIESGNQIYHERERADMQSNPKELVCVLRCAETSDAFAIT